MEDEKSSDIVINVTILDAISLGRISVDMKVSGQATIQLPYGRLKIKSGEDYMTGSFSSVKREYTDVHGQYKMWRECHFGELNIPDPGEKNHVILDGIPYEIIIATLSESGQDGDADMGVRKSYISCSDVTEKFRSHRCTRDCMPHCPGGVWIRDQN